MAEVIFGTDGARGEWGHEIDAETGYKIGAGAAETLGATDFILVQDTRRFNPELAEAVTEGLVANNMVVHNAGVLPTPAAAILAHSLSGRFRRPVAAISLSASHNPARDAGIKVFGAGGLKLDDEATDRLAKAANAVTRQAQRSQTQPTAVPAEELRTLYTDYLLSTVDPELRRSRFLSGLHIVADTANGAAHWSEPYVLTELGATVHSIFADPTAEINNGCGATHIEAMIAETKRRGAHYGTSKDGDADRNISYAPETGRILDGDDALAVAAITMIALGKQPRGTAITAYSNLGLEIALNELGVPIIETATGDRYVLQAMLGRDLPFGGENSGHTLYRNVAQRLDGVLTGDGTLTSLQLLQAGALLGKPLGQISNWERQPHVQDNVSVGRGTNVKQLLNRPDVATKITEVTSNYAGKIHLRGSGTEPLARVLVKGGESQEAAAKTSGLIAAIIREAAGA